MNLAADSRFALDWIVTPSLLCRVVATRRRLLADGLLVSPGSIDPEFQVPGQYPPANRASIAGIRMHSCIFQTTNSMGGKP